ncbi:hypothetical protein HY627_01420 [Candidatus Uhrbacteria bacterium]|nr:hypothetical protein [Candidatus Uhrbacteria bacterium]
MRLLALLGILLIGCRQAPISPPIDSSEPGRSVAVPQPMAVAPQTEPVTIIIQPAGQQVLPQANQNQSPFPITAPVPLPQGTQGQPVPQYQQPIPAGAYQGLTPPLSQYQPAAQQPYSPMQSIPTLPPPSQAGYQQPPSPLPPSPILANPWPWPTPPIQTVPVSPYPPQTAPFPNPLPPPQTQPPSDPFDPDIPDLPDFIF